MGFSKFVQIGRVVRINYGHDEGKLATIVDIVNDKRALIDGPQSGVARQVIPIRRLTLTQFHIKEVLRGQRSVLLRKKIEKFDLVKKYAATGAAKREAALKLRAGLSDFQRFKVMVLKKRRSAIVKHQVRVLGKQVKGTVTKKPAQKAEQKPKKEKK